MYSVLKWCSNGAQLLYEEKGRPHIWERSSISRGNFPYMGYYLGHGRLWSSDPRSDAELWDVMEVEREKAVMEGLRALASRAEIVEVSGWVHPYGWLLDPEGACKAILKFLGNTADTTHE